MGERSFNNHITVDYVEQELNKIRLTIDISNKQRIKDIFSFIDLTTLNTTDNNTVVQKMIEKVNDFHNFYPEFPSVAAVCVYPNFVKTVKNTLSQKDVKIACVTGGFPSSQTFLSIKLAETNLAAEKGADEVDMVLSVGTFREGNLQECSDEIALIKASAGKAHLKVILESGILGSLQDIYTASLLSMEAGADFIKTSTGKTEPAATPQAVFVMCLAIKEYFQKTGRKVGLKPAGGIATTDNAMLYAAIVENVLGNDWLNNHLFRIGASRLANDLLNKYYEKGNDICYF